MAFFLILIILNSLSVLIFSEIFSYEKLVKFQELSPFNPTTTNINPRPKRFIEALLLGGAASYVFHKAAKAIKKRRDRKKYRHHPHHNIHHHLPHPTLHYDNDHSEEIYSSEDYSSNQHHNHQNYHHPPSHHHSPKHHSPNHSDHSTHHWI